MAESVVQKVREHERKQDKSGRQSPRLRVVKPQQPCLARGWRGCLCCSRGCVRRWRALIRSRPGGGIGRPEPGCHIAKGQHRSGVTTRRARPRRSRLPSEPPSQSWTAAAREGVGIRTRSNTVGPVRGNPPRTAARNRTVLIDRLPHRTPGRNTAPLIWHRPRAGFRPSVWTSAGVALFPNDEPGSGSWPGSRSNQMEHQRIAIASPAQPRAFTALRPLSRE